MTTDKPFYAPDNPGAFASKRAARPGQLAWTMTKGGRTYRAELRDLGDYGCELQLLLDGELRTGRWFHTRAIAEAEASVAQGILTDKGWALSHRADHP